MSSKSIGFFENNKKLNILFTVSSRYNAVDIYNMLV